VTRTAEDAFLVVTAAATQNRDFAWLKRHISADALLCDRHHVRHGRARCDGPALARAPVELTPADLSNAAFPFATSQEIDLGYARVRASRITYVGELGWELYVPTEFVQGVYDALVDEGAPLGLKLAGYHALNSLRMEKAYRHWGHDITDEDDPLEAGLGFAVAWDKGDFVGREALLRRGRQA
jgi:4-methylaminobutanoate oxidase (formaldehyde-forming)